MTQSEADPETHTHRSLAEAGWCGPASDATHEQIVTPHEDTDPRRLVISAQDEDDLDLALETLWIPSEDAPDDTSDLRHEQQSARPSKSSRRPLKQIVADLRGASNRRVQFYLKEYDRKLERRGQISQIAKNEDRKAKRREKRESPRRAIEEKAKRRLNILDLAIKYRRGDKLLEQLVGRSEELVQFWTALRLAALTVEPRKPCDQEIADEFAKLRGVPCSRHQARGRRILIDRLNTHPGVWFKLRDN